MSRLLKQTFGYDDQGEYRPQVLPVRRFLDRQPDGKLSDFKRFDSPAEVKCRSGLAKGRERRVSIGRDNADAVQRRKCTAKPGCDALHPLR